MRGQRDICIFCRHVLKPPNINVSTRRYASRKAKAEPYVLSRTIIDLDANDSKFVRKLEELADDAPNADDVDRRKLQRRMKWLDSKIRQRATMTEPHLKQPTTIDPTLKLNSFETTVTPPDLLSFALNGDPYSRKASGQKSSLGRLFAAQRIHSSDSVEIKTKRLTHGITTDFSHMLLQANFPSVLEEEIFVEIASSDSWTKFHRMVSILSSTREGCELLARNGESIVLGIRSCRKGQEDGARVYVQQIVVFLNNLALNLRSRGIQIGASLCNAGLYYAAKAGALPALEMYVRISRDAHYPTNWHTEQAIVFLAARLIRNGLSDTNSLPRESLQHRFMTLLTGWKRDDGSLSGEERQPSFADLLSHEFKTSDRNDTNLGFHGRYLMILGDIGYKQTLLLDWKRLGDPKIAALSYTNSDKLENQHISAIAFLLAKDRAQALSILKTIPKENEGEKTGKNSPWLDSKVQRPTLWVLHNHYFMHGLKSSETLEQQVKKSIPRNPEQAISAIDRLLFTDSPGYKPGVLDWATVDGKEGLRVEDAGVLEYFKPANMAN